MAAAVQVFKDNKIDADRLTTEKEAENDVKMRRARALDDLTRAFEAKVTELVGGLSAASSVMEDTAQSMSATAPPPIARPPWGRRLGSDLDQRADGRQRDRGADLLDLGDRPPGRDLDRDRARRRPRPAHRRCHRAFAGEGAQKIGDVVTLIQSIAAQTNLLALNATIEAARRRSRPRLCRRRLGGEVAGRQTAKATTRFRADHRDPDRERRDRDRDQERRRRHHRDRPDRYRDCGRDRGTGSATRRSRAFVRPPAAPRRSTPTSRACSAPPTTPARRQQAGRGRTALDPVEGPRRPGQPLPLDVRAA